jgi:protein O-GlcNAc transferase
MVNASIQQAYHLALEHHQSGRLKDARALYERILVQEPNHADALHLLGVIAHQTGQNQRAVELIGRAIAINSAAAMYHNNLGIAFKEIGQTESAIASYRNAIRLKPDFAAALYNLGKVLLEYGQLDQAIAALRASIQFQPNSAAAYNSLGIALRNQRKPEESVQAYQAALKIKPDYFEAQNNLGNALRDLRRMEDAAAAYRAALQIKPDLAETHNNLGTVLQAQGYIDQAIGEFRKAQELKPDYTGAASNLLYNLYFYASDPKTIYDEHVQWNQRQAQELKKFIKTHTNDQNPNRKLRIGYVSPDFREHCQSIFTVPLFLNHDHEQFEIYCYANVINPDALTRRLRGYADVWQSIVGLNHQQAADLIRKDQIDILVDLAMHMASSTPLLFATKPAPIQVAWLAYPGTTGLTTMDYRFTDPRLDPPGLDDAFYTEESIRLPDTFWCYDPLAATTEVKELPAIKNGYITFGCLNNFCKVNDGVLQLWARVLRGVPRSHLILLAPAGPVRQDVIAKLGQDGITAQRIEFVDFKPRADYLNLYNRIDLVLDTFPYNGHTTSLDSFWMGVPVVTLVGKTVVGRAGLSQLHNLDLKELAARTQEEYVEIALKLAGDLTRLRELRSKLRGRMKASPLMDAKRFAHNIESAYRDMWRKWCAKSESTT